MIRTWRVRGLVILAAVPLLGAVPMAAMAHAEGSAPSVRNGPRDAAPKPPPRPRTHAKPKPAKGKPRAQHVKGVTLRTDGPGKDVIPGRAYEWTWTFRVTGKSRARAGRAVFRTTLPRTLAYVSGEEHCVSSGRKVACRLGAVRRGRTISGTIKAKVARWAEPGRTIGMRGTVTWGGKRVSRRFPQVRVARTADLAIIETALSKARAGARFPYEVRVRDLGPSPTVDADDSNNRAVVRTGITGRR